jgi:CopG family transcriptional regulator, nickel-responsive regulator
MQQGYNWEGIMERITIVLDEELVTEVDHLVSANSYQNRSEAIRDLVRAGIRQAAEARGVEGDCLAALVYAYDYTERDLGKRIGKAMHDHHHLSVASLQVYLDHHTRMQLDVLGGSSAQVRNLGERIIAERGVRHGRLIMLPAEFRIESHAHSGTASHKHRHMHVRQAG